MRSMCILVFSMGLRHPTTRSFKYAFQGLFTATKNEPNFRIHLFFATLAILMGIFFDISPIEWIVLSMTIFYVLSLELINTVVEALVNLVSPDIRPEAKVAKDVSAAVVLTAAILSIAVGCFLFLPKLMLLVQI